MCLRRFRLRDILGRNKLGRYRLGRNRTRKWSSRTASVLSRRPLLTLPDLGDSLGDILDVDILITPALGHYAVIKRYVGISAAYFSHLESRGCFTRDV